MKCQVVFRTRRGGSGLDYATVRAEFLSRFGPYILQILRELPGRYRLWALIGLPPHAITRLAQELGYTQCILAVHEEAYQGQPQQAEACGRWWRGWFLRHGRWIFQEELYVQDEKMWHEESPHLEPLIVVHRGELVKRVGHRAQRGLSPLDARFLVNITDVSPGAKVLDPFAGFGGIVLACDRRGLVSFASDWELKLMPGLRERVPERLVAADARALPFSDGSFDALITEPPFRTPYRQAVLEALPELHRVTSGPMTFFVAQDMVDGIVRYLTAMGRSQKACYWVRRNRGLRCAALCFR